MEQTLSDAEIIEDLDYDTPPMCEHTRHDDDERWHSDENGVFEVIVYCEKCEPKIVLFCTAYVTRRIWAHPYDKVWCFDCHSRMYIKDSYTVLDRVR